MTAKPIPDGYHSITPYLLVNGVGELSTFLHAAFGATELSRLDRPDGTIMHIEARIGDSIVMMGEPMNEFGPMPASIYLYVDDCDTVYRRAVEAGGVSVMEPMDMVHAGERYGGVKDPSGNLWWIATHIEDVPLEEQKRRVEAARERWNERHGGEG